MRPSTNLRASSIAIATILAMLLVPACGSLCAAMNHCSTATANTNSDSNADSCHHNHVSTAASDSADLAVSSLASCGERAPLLAVLTSSDEFSQLKSSSESVVPFVIDLPNRSSALVAALHESLPAGESPQTQHPVPLEALSVLRI